MLADTWKTTRKDAWLDVSIQLEIPIWIESKWTGKYKSIAAIGMLIHTEMGYQLATWVLPNNFHGWSGPQSVTQTAAAAAGGATHFDTDSDNLFRLHLEKNSHGLINYRKFLNSIDKNWFFTHDNEAARGRYAFDSIQSGHR